MKKLILSINLLLFAVGFHNLLGMKQKKIEVADFEDLVGVPQIPKDVIRLNDDSENNESNRRLRVNYEKDIVAWKKKKAKKFINHAASQFYFLNGRLPYQLEKINSEGLEIKKNEILRFFGNFIAAHYFIYHIWNEGIPFVEENKRTLEKIERESGRDKIINELQDTYQKNTVLYKKEKKCIEKVQKLYSKEQLAKRRNNKKFFWLFGADGHRHSK